MTKTVHPEELLAEYVDGTLDEDARRGVEAHLAACVACRAEVGLAGAARRTLHSLPEEPVPLGVTGRVLEEASGARRSRERAPWGQRIQWVAGLAAAAALVGLLAVSLPNLVTGSSEEGAAGAPEIAAEPGGGHPTRTVAPQDAFAVSLEQVDRDFDDEALRRLATDVAEAVRAGSLRAPAAEGTSEETQEALDCIVTWAGAPQDEVLVRLLRARYKGRDAYVAVYLRGPGVDEPPSRATVWVVSTQGCRFLDITEANI